MPRRKRVVIPNIPHHVTQRGVRKQITFFKQSDRKVYLKLLAENCKRYGTLVLGYCLMSNHVHHLLVPLKQDSLRWTMQFTHKRYADYINGQNGWTGHLWQEKFYSSPVDEAYFWMTLRYIERNPVEAKLVKHASEYFWSSASAHCRLRDDPLLTKNSYWNKILDSRKNWYDWLNEIDPIENISILRKNTLRDLPTGSENFLNELEEKYNVVARARKQGRPKKDKS